MAVEHGQVHGGDSGNDAGHGHHPNYLAIFGFLIVCTILSWIADEMKQRGIGLFDNKPFVIVVVLAIATAKALFVMMFFMHLKFEGRWKYVLLAPTVVLAMGIPLALMPDIGVHYYSVESEQPAEAFGSGAPGAADDTGEGHRGH